MDLISILAKRSIDIYCVFSFLHIQSIKNKKNNNEKGVIGIYIYTKEFHTSKNHVRNSAFFTSKYIIFSIFP